MAVTWIIGEGGPRLPQRRYQATITATAAGDTPLTKVEVLEVIAPGEGSARAIATIAAGVRYPAKWGWRHVVEVAECAA